MVLDNDGNLEGRLLDATAVNLVAAYDKVLKIIDGEIPLPEVVELFTTNFCSFSCPFCRCSEYHGDSSQYLDFPLFARLLSELSQQGVKTLEMGGGGEPLEHPRIEEMLTLLASEGFRLGLITSGYVMTSNPGLVDPLLQCSDWIRFSVDAISDEVYRTVHGRHRVLYSALKNTMTDIVQSVRAQPPGNRISKIGMKIIIQQPNEDEVLRVVDEALEIGVHYLQFKWLEEHPWSIPLERRPGLIADLKKQIAEIPQESLMVDLLSGYGGPRMQGRCVMSVLHPVVDWDGAVYLCAFYHHRRKSHSIGNIKVNRFFEIWGSEHHRDQIGNVDSNQCVPSCPLLRYEPIVRYILNEAFRFRYI